jgi:molybdenum cofactor biosynthesis protein B
LEKVLPGFGELFRWLSYGEIGSAAVLSRALCGVSRGRVICCLPGSEEAVRLGLSKVLLPELPHLVWVASH